MVFKIVFHVAIVYPWKSGKTKTLDVHKKASRHFSRAAKAGKMVVEREATWLERALESAACSVQWVQWVQGAALSVCHVGGTSQWQVTALSEGLPAANGRGTAQCGITRWAYASRAAPCRAEHASLFTRLHTHTPPPADYLASTHYFTLAQLTLSLSLYKRG